MPGYELDINIVGHDRASGPLRSVSLALERVGTIAMGYIAARLFEGIAEGIFQIGIQSIDAAARMELMQVTLASLVSREMVQLSASGEAVADVFPRAERAAAGLMDQLARLSILSPYEMDTVMYTYRMAMAFGYGTQEALQFTRGLLNMAAGIGADMSMMERMAYNFAQIRLQGKVTALDIRQLALAGFDLNSVLRDVSKQFGYNITDYKDFNKLIAESKISWKDFTTGFESYADRMFSGAAERMSRTLIGLKSTFKDFFTLTMPRVVGPALSEVVGALNGLLNVFLKIRDTPLLDEIGEKLQAPFKKAMAPLKAFADSLTTYFSGLAGAKEELAAAIASGDDERIHYAQKRLDGYGPILDEVKKAFRSAFGEETYQKIVDVWTGLRNVYDTLRTVWNAVKDLLSGNFAKFATDIGLTGQAADTVATALTTVRDVVRNIADAFIKLLEGDPKGALEALKLPPGVEKGITNVAIGLGNLATFLLENGPSFVETLGKIVLGILGLTAPDIDKGVGDIGESFKNFTQTLVDNGPKMMDSFSTFADRLVNEWIPNIKSSISTFVNETLPKLFDGLTKLKNIAIPVLTAIMGAFAFFGTLKLIPLLIDLGKLTETFSLLHTAAGGLGPMLTGMFGPLAASLGAALPTLGIIVGALLLIVGAIVGIGAAYRANFGGFATFINAIGAAISETLAPAFAQVQAAFAQLGTAFSELWVAIQPILTVLGAVIMGVLTLVTSVLTAAFAAVASFFAGFVSMFAGVISGLATMFQGVVDLVSGLWAIIVGIFTGNGAAIKGGLIQLWEGIKGIFGGALQAIWALVSGVFTTIVQTVWTFIKSIIDFFVNLYDELVGHSIIPDMMKDIFNTFVTWFDDIITRVREFIGKFLQFGTDLVNGIKEGIKNAWDGFVSWFQGLIDKLPKFVKDILKISSPSRVFAALGVNMMAGLQQGIKKGAVGVLDALGNTMNGLTVQAHVGLSGATGQFTRPGNVQNNWDITVEVNGADVGQIDSETLGRIIIGTIQRERLMNA